MKYHLQIFSTSASIAKNLETNSMKKWTSFKKRIAILICKQKAIRFVITLIMFNSMPSGLHDSKYLQRKLTKLNSHSNFKCIY